MKHSFNARLAQLALCLAALVPALPVHAASDAQAAPQVRTNEDADFAAGLEAYERNHWYAAFATFARLADSGHPAAARIAVLMWRNGPALYRTDFAASPAQVERWASAGRCGIDAGDATCAVLVQRR